MDNTISADTSWILATVFTTLAFCIVLVCVYLWKQGLFSRARWAQQKPHIHSRESLNEIEDPTVMICLLPNGVTVHSEKYTYGPKKRDVFLKMSKSIPSEYQNNVLTKALNFVGKREGTALAYLSGVFESEDTLVITISKRNTEPELGTNEQDAELTSSESAWWG